MKLSVPRATYANVTATLALVVALGGTGYAAVNLPKNSVGSKQIVNDSIKSVDVKNNGLKGADVDESTLSPVPRAATAADADALGGRSLRGLLQWALVDSEGTLISSSGSVSSTGLGVGRFRVDFPGAVGGCGMNANVTSGAPVADDATLSSAFALVARSSASASSVVVQTRDDAGTLAGRPFVVTVQC